jgi:hypothetical protein
MVIWFGYTKTQSLSCVFTASLGALGSEGGCVGLEDIIIAFNSIEYKTSQTTSLYMGSLMKWRFRLFCI